MAIGAETVQGGNADSGGEISVATAAGRCVLQVETDLRRETACMFVKCGDPLVLLVGRSVEAASDPQLDVRIIRFEVQILSTYSSASAGVGMRRSTPMTHSPGTTLTPVALNFADIEGDALLVPVIASISTIWRAISRMALRHLVAQPAALAGRWFGFRTGALVFGHTFIAVAGSGPTRICAF